MNRRNAVQNARVIDKNSIQSIRKRERAEALCTAINLRNAALDILSAYQQNTNPFNTVAMGAFWCRQPGFRPIRFDPELMHLDMPYFSGGRFRTGFLEDAPATTENATSQRMDGDGIAHRLEPANGPTIQRIVVAAFAS